MLLPKKTKFRKHHRGRREGTAKGQTTVQFGDFGLKALEAGWLTNRQIEAARIAPPPGPGRNHATPRRRRRRARAPPPDRLVRAPPTPHRAPPRAAPGSRGQGPTRGCVPRGDVASPTLALETREARRAAPARVASPVAAACDRELDQLGGRPPIPSGACLHLP